MQAYLYHLFMTLTGGHNDSLHSILNIEAGKILSSGDLLEMDKCTEGKIIRLFSWNFTAFKKILYLGKNGYESISSNDLSQ